MKFKLDQKSYSSISSFLFSLTGIFTYDDFENQILYANLYDIVHQYSMKFLEHEKLNPTNLSTLLMAWAKVRLRDPKLFTFASVTLADSDFYE